MPDAPNDPGFANPPGDAHPAGDSAGRPGPRVLIVDDNEHMRMYMCGCLRKLGLKNTVEAANGDEALRLAHESAVALIISDVAMPVMDGYELCRRVKSDEMLRGVPVLLVTGEATIPPADALSDDLLTKPFNGEALRERVRLLLDLDDLRRPTQP